MNLVSKLSHTSVSSINSFQNCPRGWWNSYVLKMKQESSVAASFGNQYDSLIAHRLGLEPMDVRERDKDKPTISQQIWLDGLEEAVDGYFEQDHAITKEEAVSTQKKIEIPVHAWSIMAEQLGLSLDIHFPIVGYVDLISQKGLTKKITDLKTSKRKGMRADWAFQLLIYCLAENCGSADIHLMTTTKVPAYYKYPVIVTDETKAWAMKKYTFIDNLIHRALEEGSGENLPCNSDYWCMWCAESENCPAKNSFMG